MPLRPNRVSLGQNVFPSSSAGTGVVDIDGLYRCMQCGFINDKAEVESPGGTAEGDGGVSVTVSASVGDPTVTAYCAFCGSANSRQGGK